MKIRWIKRLKVMRVSTVGIIVSIILLLIFAGFTIYGNKVGNFVISVDFDNIKLSLSAYEDYSHQTERLTFNGLNAVDNTSYGFLPDNVAEGIGEKSVNNRKTKTSYMAFSFYLINNSEKAVDYLMNLNVVGTVGDPLPIIRVMLIDGDKSTFDTGNRIYALKESSRENERILNEGLNEIRPYQTEDFISERRIFSINVHDFAAGAKEKYTVLIWLEGCDAECTNERIGSRVKLQLDFIGY